MKIDGRKARGTLTRARILEATRALLPDLGGDLTLDAIALRVEMTKQAILHHFPSKERLLVELCLEVVQAESDVAIAAVAGLSGTAALEAFVRALTAFYVDDIEGFRLLYHRSQLYPGAIRWFPLEERRDRLYPLTGAMYDAAESAVRAGLPHPDLDVRSLVVAAHFSAIGFATLHGATTASGDPMKRPFAAYLDTLLSTWTAGLPLTAPQQQGSGSNTSSR